ncbi:MAG: response regulator transcription factor [Acidimicrobiales bacterium]|nr:response regulator transcription factor [Acidimicrobiales bacterium]
MDKSPNAGTVLVVDDEPTVRDVVAEYLRREGYEVHALGDGSAATDWLAVNTPDLVVLDVMLPGTDGLTVLKELRRGSDVPVILLTARVEEVDRILGLELGADDYVVKPFSPREVAARVRSVLRRTQPVAAPVGGGGTVGEEPVLDFGALRIDRLAREVEVDDRLVTLTPKEFDLLEHLASSPRQVFSRRQLLTSVWDSSPDYQDPATVTVHVGRLRQKLEADADEPRWIVTVWGVGYRFEP